MNLNYDRIILLMLYILLALAIFAGCKSQKVETVVETQTVYKDSIVYRDSLIKVSVPYEVDKEVCPKLDTLHLQTSVAEAYAWLDESKQMLVGRIANKNTSVTKIVKLPTRYITKYIKRTETNTKVVNKTPSWVKPFMWTGIVVILLALAYLGYNIYIRFLKK